MMQQESRVRSLEDCVRVGEAAVILGVTPKTLRNWDRAGKVIARRHPVNGYRIYLREELEKLLNAERGCQQ
jgi:DNA-binding transcriptional MerR regulator